MDANILFRAVFGMKVPSLLAKYESNSTYFTPAYCYDELRKHVPKLARANKLNMNVVSEKIEKLEQVVISLEEEIYVSKEAEAKRRIQDRDVHDWPIVACAMALNCPIWTEDQDFFGTGIPIWNSRNVEIFLSD